MGTIIGFVVGYVIGVRAGDKGWEELEGSLRTITSSPEVRDLVAGALSTARDLMAQGQRSADRPRLRVA
ncbi:MAG TPA: hypothetical protein VFA84_08670 [Acidimicrobiales bacterium]|nr:hypothetical protein [Acidimicrobiales bacterium]